LVRFVDRISTEITGQRRMDLHLEVDRSGASPDATA
jgi:hypothetical protein